jgi:phosphonate transport system substrate-binding protein
MKLLRFLIFLSPLLLFIIIATVRESGKYSTELGSEKNPIKLFFTPSVDSKQITTTAKELLDFLERETGYHFTSAIPADYVTVVESFGSSKADIAVINTFSYLMANKKYGAQALLRVVRDNGEAFYRGQIIVRSDSGIDSVSDLMSKKIAYVDPSSTSGYILPAALLKKQGITLSDSIFAKKHDNVVRMVYQKQVDAGATYYSPKDEKGNFRDARERVVTEHPDVFQKIKIIALTEPIPNDPVVFRKGLSEEMKEVIVAAFLKFVSTKSGQLSLYRIYNVKKLIPTTDKDYDVLRKILDDINFKIEGAL